MNRRNRDVVFQEVVTVIGAIAVLYMAKRVMAPDFGRNLRMRTALVVKRVADVQVKSWERVAGDAATAYNKARV